MQHKRSCPWIYFLGKNSSQVMASFGEMSRGEGSGASLRTRRTTSSDDEQGVRACLLGLIGRPPALTQKEGICFGFLTELPCLSATGQETCHSSEIKLTCHTGEQGVIQQAESLTVGLQVTGETACRDSERMRRNRGWVTKRNRSAGDLTLPKYFEILGL